jgi:hypothetical protein
LVSRAYGTTELATIRKLSASLLRTRRVREQRAALGEGSPGWLTHDDGKLLVAKVRVNFPIHTLDWPDAREARRWAGILASLQRVGIPVPRFAALGYEDCINASFLHLERVDGAPVSEHVGRVACRLGELLQRAHQAGMTSRRPWHELFRMTPQGLMLVGLTDVVKTHHAPEQLAKSSLPRALPPTASRATLLRFLLGYLGQPKPDANTRRWFRVVWSARQHGRVTAKF